MTRDAYKVLALLAVGYVFGWFPSLDTAPASLPRKIANGSA
jgi:hypothetical protein